MQRRNFVKSTVGLAGAAVTGESVAGNWHSQPASLAKNTFKLKYAPHFGMFENSAGKDPIDQLKFMADMGFTAMEDNGMMGRDPALQTKIGEEMARLGMAMGVFVLEKGGNSQNTLAAGKPEFIEIFLNGCRKAVETAKRVNAKFYDRCTRRFRTEFAHRYSRQGTSLMRYDGVPTFWHPPD